jgi:multiple sugar transport system permease protein
MMRKGLHRNAASQGVLYTLPVTLFLALFIVFPLLYNLRLSFVNDSGRFLGVLTYSRVLSDSSFWSSLRITLIYVGGSVLFQMLLGVAVGIALDRGFAWQSAARSTVLIPWVIPGAVAATTWAWMYHGDFGIISRLLIDLGISEARHGLLTIPSTVLGALILVNVWKMFPFVAVMTLAGLQGVDRALYEAARVDGSTFLQEVRYIMIPNLRSVLVSQLLLLTIWGFNSITIVYTMTQGGPADLSMILPLHIYNQGFQFFNFGYAAAESILLFLILTVLIILYLRVFASDRQSAP